MADEQTPVAWGTFARAICESEGRDWTALDNPREDCERWIKAGHACALASPPPSGEVEALRQAAMLGLEMAKANGLDCTAEKIAEALSSAPSSAFTAAIDTDNSLQAAAREAGWALMELINKIDWTKRHQVEGIITRLGAALSAEKQTKPIICDVLTIQHSSGFPDHFTRIRVGDRQLTTYMSKIKGQCGYHAAEFDWLLNGADKPDILAFNYDEPEGLAEYLKSIAPATSDGWRTMEDGAPKDGTVILVVKAPKGEAYAAYYGAAKDAYGAGVADQNYPWVFLDPTNGVNGLSDNEHGPTHWMPLPAAPTATGGR